MNTAKYNDNLRARELCAGLKNDEIIIFDRAYNDFDHLMKLDKRGVQWVGRWKKRTVCEVMDTMETSGDIITEELVVLNNELFVLRITASKEVDGKRREMRFVTNNREWSTQTICDLYKARWQIEVYFKQIKFSCRIGTKPNLNRLHPLHRPGQSNGMIHPTGKLSNAPTDHG